MNANKVAVWGLVYVVLAGVVGFVTDWGRGMHPAAPVARPAAAAPLDYPIQPEFSLPPLEQGFAETTARPVFTSVRRPPPPHEPSKPAMIKGQFTLLGVLIVEEKSIALLREIASGKFVRVEQGKEINGIKLESVQAEKVTLTQYDESEELTLKIQSMPKPPTVAKTAPAQAGQAAEQLAAQQAVEGSKATGEKSAKQRARATALRERTNRTPRDRANRVQRERANKAPREKANR